MISIRDTGTHSDGLTPTIAVSGGRGNTDRPEVNIIFRETDGASTRTLQGWFDRDDLIAAIEAAA
ncbi:MAG: hypothetical protein K0Q52_212 [Microbacterium sp.]|nr:hypothetical protein [Microbacterium sp.]